MSLARHEHALGDQFAQALQASAPGDDFHDSRLTAIDHLHVSDEILQQALCGNQRFQGADVGVLLPHVQFAADHLRERRGAHGRMLRHRLNCRSDSREVGNAVGEWGCLDIGLHMLLLKFDDLICQPQRDLLIALRPGFGPMLHVERESGTRTTVPP